MLSGYEARYTHLMVISPVSLLVHCPHTSDSMRTMATHILGSFLASKCLSFLLRSQIKQEKLENEKCLDSILKKCSFKIGDYPQKKRPLESNDGKIQSICSPNSIKKRLNSIKKAINCDKEKHRKQICSPAKLSDVSFNYLHFESQIKSSLEKLRLEDSKKNYINASTKRKESIQDTCSSKSPKKLQACTNRFLPEFYSEKTDNNVNFKIKPPKKLSQKHIKSERLSSVTTLDSTKTYTDPTLDINQSIIIDSDKKDEDHTTERTHRNKNITVKKSLPEYYLEKTDSNVNSEIKPRKKLSQKHRRPEKKSSGTTMDSRKTYTFGPLDSDKEEDTFSEKNYKNKNITVKRTLCSVRKWLENATEKLKDSIASPIQTFSDEIWKGSTVDGNNDDDRDEVTDRSNNNKIIIKDQCRCSKCRHSFRDNIHKRKS